MDNERKDVRLVDLGAELGLSGPKKWCARRDLDIFQRGSHQNSPWFISAADADKARELKVDDDSFIPANKSAPSGISGVYAVEVPSFSGQTRIKIGWSDNIHGRLSTYRTIIPDLKIQKIWPTTEKWTEQYALKWAKANGDTIHTELFTFDDPAQRLTDLGDHFKAIGIREDLAHGIP